MKRFRNILYVIEPSAAQDQGLARAASLTENNQAALTLIDVIPEEMLDLSLVPDAPSAADFRAAVIAERRAWIESLIVSHADRIDYHIEVLTGIRFLEVIRAVLRDAYDLVIKTAEAPDWSRLLFGSDDMHLMRKCPCPVWLMKPEEKHNFQCIVAAVDVDIHRAVSEQQLLNDCIVDIASSLALSDFAQLHLVHAWDAPEAGFAGLWTDNPISAERQIIEGEYSRHKNSMERLTHRLRERIGTDTYDYLSPQVHLPRGSARKQLPLLVEALKADMVVMRTLARTGIPGFIIGNTAEAVLYQLQCSVLALKPPGFTSPITLD